MSQTVSALITLYHGNKADEVELTLRSLQLQTRPADEIVLVYDGPVPDDVDAVVRRLMAEDPTIRVVETPENQGSAKASNAGLATIDADWIVRLDADDVAHPERLERQMAYLQAHPEVDVLGTAMMEFDGDHLRELDLENLRADDLLTAPGKELGVRALPCEAKAVRKYAKLRIPANHPSSIMRRETVERAGGYQDVRFMEDYDMLARMLGQGAVIENLDEPLTYFRMSSQALKRRKASGLLSAEWQMQRNLHSYGLISWPRAVVNLVIRTGFRLIPTRLLGVVYAAIFRR